MKFEVHTPCLVRITIRSRMKIYHDNFTVWVEDWNQTLPATDIQINNSSRHLELEKIENCKSWERHFHFKLQKGGIGLAQLELDILLTAVCCFLPGLVTGCDRFRENGFGAQSTDHSAGMAQHRPLTLQFEQMMIDDSMMWFSLGHQAAGIF